MTRGFEIFYKLNGQLTTVFHQCFIFPVIKYREEEFLNQLSLIVYESDVAAKVKTEVYVDSQICQLGTAFCVGVFQEKTGERGFPFLCKITRFQGVNLKGPFSEIFAQQRKIELEMVLVDEPIFMVAVKYGIVGMESQSYQVGRKMRNVTDEDEKYGTQRGALMDVRE